jgi:methylase of polypeptide subunit release factors
MICICIMKKKCRTELEKEFDAGMARILKQEPMEHVLGYSWFYGYKMIVNEDVLIPASGDRRALCEYPCPHGQVLFRTGDH